MIKLNAKNLSILLRRMSAVVLGIWAFYLLFCFGIKFIFWGLYKGVTFINALFSALV